MPWISNTCISSPVPYIGGDGEDPEGPVDLDSPLSPDPDLSDDLSKSPTRPMHRSSTVDWTSETTVDFLTLLENFTKVLQVIFCNVYILVGNWWWTSPPFCLVGKVTAAKEWSGGRWGCTWGRIERYEVISCDNTIIDGIEMIVGIHWASWM